MLRHAKALGCLKVLTVAKHMMAEDLALQIDTMASEMTEYPLDVARDACRAWARANKFFPSWAELRELCEDGVRFRRALARELRRILDGLDQEAEAAPAAPPACAVWEDTPAEGQGRARRGGLAILVEPSDAVQR